MHFYFSIGPPALQRNVLTIPQPCFGRNKYYLMIFLPETVLFQTLNSVGFEWFKMDHGNPGGFAKTQAVAPSR